MRESPERFIVPVDGSEDAATAAALAAGMAARLNIPVHLLFVFPVSPAAGLGLPGGGLSRPETNYFKPNALENARKKAAARAFRMAREAMGNNGVAIDETVLTGVPGDTIVEYARDVPGAMIVMGRRGLSPIKKILLGSVSQRVIDMATCPVTVAH